VSLDKGSSTLKRFYIEGKIPDDILVKFTEGAFQYAKLNVDVKNSGFAVFNNELSPEFNDENSKFGRFYVVSLRTDTLKVKRKTLEMKVNQFVCNLKATGEVVSSIKKAEFTQDLIETDGSVTTVDTNIVNVIIDTHGIMYMNTNSIESEDLIVGLIFKHLGIKVLQANPFSVVSKNYNQDVMDNALDYPSMEVIDNEVHPEFEDSPEGKIGSGFLTWLMYYLNTGDGLFNHMGISFLDTVTLEGESMGSKQAVLKKGCISSCVELTASLKVGKTISSAKLLIAEANGDEVNNFEFTIDKATFSLSSCKVPKGLMLERILHFVNCFETIDSLFSAYIDTRYGKKWDKDKSKIKKWIEEL